MSLTSIEKLPDSSRIWIFAADRQLSSSESAELLSTLDTYLQSWKAHGAPVEAARDLRYDQFLFIIANPDVTAPSGCSIDNMTHAIRALGEKFHVNFFDTMSVFYRDGANVRIVDRPTFKQLAKNGEVSTDTVVFNNALTSLEEIRKGRWEVAARDSWHARLVSPVTTSVTE